MTTENNNTWNFFMTPSPPLTANSSNEMYINIENLLNTSSLYTRDYTNQVLYNTTNYIPIYNNSYGIICGTRILPSINGSLNINIIASSSSNIDLYISSNTNVALNTTRYTLTGAANSLLTQNIPMQLNTEYTILLTQFNSTINTSLFINTNYSNSGKFFGINNPFNPPNNSISSTMC